MKKADYGSYVRNELIVLALAAGATVMALRSLAKKRLHRTVSLAAGGVLLLMAVFMVHMAVSHRDPRKLAIRDALLELLSWSGDGRALDIGTGSGLLAIGLAKKFPAARVVGTDIWKWTSGSGLTKERAEENAVAEGVCDRVSFEFGDARELPFQDASFDTVVTNLVWHNVSVADRFSLIEKALRLLKPGGSFVFSDLFKSKLAYGDFNRLKERLEKEVSSCQVKEWPE